MTDHAEPREPLLESLFSSRVRVRLLAAFLGPEGAQYHARELSKQTGEHFNAVWQELKHLEAIGLLRTEKAGNQVRYTPDPAFPLLPELRSLIRRATSATPEVAQASGPDLGHAGQVRPPAAAERSKPAPQRSFVIGETD